MFSGIGAFEKALHNLNIPFELINYCEIDKYASKAYSLIHNEPETKNLGDITKVKAEELQDFDLLTYGFPCTDISVAGKQQGIIVGKTRSGLLYEALRIIKAKKPKYCICENVKNLVGKKFRVDFDKLLAELESYGYRNHWKVLNAKDYGIPQNRERVFVISIRNDIEQDFEFPQTIPLTRCLADVLEDEVDEKFYISQENCERLLAQFNKPDKHSGIYINQSPNFTRPPLYNISRCIKANQHDASVVIPMLSTGQSKVDCIGNVNPSGRGMNGNVFSSECLCPTITTNKGEGIKIVEPKVKQIGQLYNTESFGGNPQVGRVYSARGVCPTLNTMQGGNRQPKVVIKEATKKGYAEATIGDSINLEQPNSKTRRGGVGHGIAQTLTTSPQQATLTPSFLIRKLTPKECFRLMGFTDADHDIVESNGISATQRYKMAGNSIVVPVLEGIFKELLK